VHIHVQTVSSFKETDMISSFHERIREPDATYISPRLMSEQLETSLSGLSRLMDLHRNTLRNPRSEALQSKLRDLARIMDRAETMLGSHDRALYWFRNQSLADYGGATPQELVEGGHVAAVSAYLDDVEAGALG